MEGHCLSSHYNLNVKLEDDGDHLRCFGYTDGSAFSIVRIGEDKNWSIAHIPSESILIYGFRRKRDAETVMHKFKQIMEDDYDGLLIYCPFKNLLPPKAWKSLYSAKDYFLYTRSFEFRFGSSN